MADTFQLEIVTPEKLVVNEPVEELQMPGADGYLGILPGHDRGDTPGLEKSTSRRRGKLPQASKAGALLRG